MQTSSDGTALARGMGWFGIGLGLVQLAAPNRLTRAVGLRADRRSAWLVRALGVRELIGGIGILLRPRRALPVWARVVGDAIDTALLAAAAVTVTRRRSVPRLASAAVAVAGAGALDAIASVRVQRAQPRPEPAHFAVTVARPRDEVYAFFRNFTLWPSFAQWLAAVYELGDRRWRWAAKLPIGGTVHWDVEITDDRPGEHFAWRSSEGAPIDVRGDLVFVDTPGRASTEVHAEVALGGGPSGALARHFARAALAGDLRRAKQVLEAGEVVRSDASIHLLPHPARPERGA